MNLLGMFSVIWALLSVYAVHQIVRIFFSSATDDEEEKDWKQTVEYFRLLPPIYISVILFLGFIAFIGIDLIGLLLVYPGDGSVLAKGIWYVGIILYGGYIQGLVVLTQIFFEAYRDDRYLLSALLERYGNIFWGRTLIYLLLALLKIIAMAIVSVYFVSHLFLS